MPIRWGHFAKRWLYLVHRWIGIFTCLLFLMWFVSGLVMVYVPFPALSPDERLAGLPSIDWSKVRVGPAGAERAAGRDVPHSVTLEMAGTEPVWRIVTDHDGARAVSAATGARLAPVGATRARQIAEAFGRARAIGVERMERDQWTVPGVYNPHRPLFRVRLGGPARRDLYVSGSTGAVVLDTDADERFWNWLGSVPHWIYPTILRQDNAAWRQVVMWVSGPCILVAVTGLWIGILRTRIGRRRFNDGRMTPYHGWMLWHHVAGLAGGVTLLLWIFSGWLSVDPGRLFASTGIAPEDRARYVGPATIPPVDPQALSRAAGDGAKRVQFDWSVGRPWTTIEGVDHASILDARTLRPAQLSQAEIVAGARMLLPSARIVSVDRLAVPDLYWYGVAELPKLPVLRVAFDDPASTWVHLDPDTGRILDTSDRRRRLYRWLFDLFHKWDLNALTLNRPAWDAFLWVFSLFGIVTSVSGIWIGCKRLVRR